MKRLILTLALLAVSALYATAQVNYIETNLSIKGIEPGEKYSDQLIRSRLGEPTEFYSDGNGVRSYTFTGSDGGILHIGYQDDSFFDCGVDCIGFTSKDYSFFHGKVRIGNDYRCIEKATPGELKKIGENEYRYSPHWDAYFILQTDDNGKLTGVWYTIPM